MSLVKKRENSGDSSSESNELSTGSWLSGELIESSDESCADSIYEDYLNARNYWNRRNAALAQKEILDRAYKFIYDEAFSNESTNESDFPVDYHTNCDIRESAMPAGDGNDFFKFKKPAAKYRWDPETNRENLKSRSSPRILSKKLINFEENRLRKRCEGSDSFLRNSVDNSEYTLRKPSRKILSKKRLKNTEYLDADTWMRRKRKLPIIAIQDRLHNSKNVHRGRTADLTSGISRWPNPRDRPMPNSKMRKMFSEQIPIADITRRASNQGHTFEDIFKENNELESSSSDDGFVIDVESVLQENTRVKNSSRLTVETVLLENTKHGTDSNVRSFRHQRPSCRHGIDAHSNEVKLLGDIKKRIDQDFEYDLNEIERVESRSSKSSDNERLEDFAGGNQQSKESSSKSSRQYFVESIDSGVSTDFSRNESDLLRNFDYPDAANSGVFNQISINSDPDDGEILEAKVEKAVQRFTEELIICERRAVERGLVEEVKNTSERKKRKKSFRKVQRSSSCSSPRSDKTFSSSRGFFKTSHSSSSEEEYLGNISPPSLCSISDSEMENFLDLHD